MVSKNISWINNIKPFIIKGFFVFIIICLSLRGISGYWSDLKEYIIRTTLVTPADIPVDNSTNSTQKIKDRVYKEKGIILTDEDIKKYGLTQ